MKIVQNKMNTASAYSLLKIDSLNLGDYLVFDVYIKKENNYLIIIEKGTMLTLELFAKLEKQEKLFISKEDLHKKSLSCENLQDYTKYNQKNIAYNLNIFNQINKKIFTNYLNSEDNTLDLDCVKSLVKSIIFLIKTKPSFLKEIMPHFTNEHELETHSLHVTIYSLSIGNLLRLSDSELLQLGTASLLHDVGIKLIDSELIAKNKKLTIQEMETIQKHPVYSTKIIKHNLLFDPYIIDAITHHHENYDGSGYPDALKGKDISVYASIISIADVFDALTNNRPARDAYKSFEALKIMMKDESMANKFNFKYLQLFLKLL